MSEIKVYNPKQSFKQNFHFFSKHPLNPLPEDFLNIKGIQGIALWGKFEEKSWAILGWFEDAQPDIAISSKQINIQIQQYNIMYEIDVPPERCSQKDFINFHKSFYRFIGRRGYQLKSFPLTKVPLALPSPPSEKEQTESFEGLITNVENNIAFTTLVDVKGDESTMEIPLDDLQKYGIQCKAGVSFSIFFKRCGDWEKVEFERTERPPMTKEELDDLTKYYEDEFGDV